MQILWNNFLGLGEAIASLLLLIDSVIYWLISELYGLYVVLAQATIFKDELYVDIANKVYLVMGVVALFIVVYVLLQSIVNPDNFRKNGMDFVKKFVIAIIMIILTPSIFNFLYTVQDAVLTDNIIENIFLGNNNTSSIAAYATYFYDTNNPNLTSEEIMAKIEDESNTEYSADKFVLDEDGESTERFLIRYIVTKDCTETDYKTAMKNCEKVDVNNLDEENNKLIKQNGNDMALTVLEAFLHPNYDSGMTDSTTIVNAANAAGVSSGKGKAGWIGCGFSAAGAIVIGGVGTAAGVISWGAGAGVTVASIGTAASLVAAACGGGYLAGGEIYEAINYDEYTWAMAKNEILSDGKFTVITAFAGDGNEGNQGIVGGEMSYTPIVSTICGFVLLYMIFGFCLDLGLRAAKLAFYQMLAPVTFLLNVLPGQKDLLTNWIKLVLTTWGEVFVRIFTMIAVVYLFSSLDMLKLEDTYGIVAKAIIVMGLVMFVKQFPKLLGDVTGIKSENMKLGIMEKLGAGGALAAGALIGGGLTAGVRNITNSWRNSKGQNLGKRIFSAAGSGIGGVTSGGVRSAKSAGFKAKSWGDLKNAASSGAKLAHDKSKDRKAYKASHGGTTLGAIKGHASDALSGVQNWAGITPDILEKVDYQEEYLAAFDDYKALYNNGAYQAMDAQLNQYDARIAAEGENAETYAGSGISLKDARASLDTQMRYKRLEAIYNNEDGAAYAMYNLAMQVKKNPTMAANAKVDAKFIQNADDFILRKGKVTHKDGTEWKAEDLQKLLEGKTANYSTNASGKTVVVGENNDATTKMYGMTDGLNVSKKHVNKDKRDTKSSIAYKEAKKAADSTKK